MNTLTMIGTRNIKIFWIVRLIEYKKDLTLTGKDRCISGGKRKEGKRIRSGKKKESWYNGGDEE